MIMHGADDANEVQHNNVTLLQCQLAVPRHNTSQIKLKRQHKAAVLHIKSSMEQSHLSMKTGGQK